MPSQTKDIREAQRQRCEAEIRKLVAELKAKGLDSAAIRRHPRLRQAKARLRQILNTLAAIAKLEQKKEAVARLKKEKAEQKLAKAQEKAGKPKAEPPAGEKKAKKEKKEKKKKEEGPPPEPAPESA